jgi:hypothetical protein
MLLLLALLAVDVPMTGVVCIAPLPRAQDHATAGKGASDGDYDDSEGARTSRVESVKRSRRPAFFAVGEVTSGPVTDRQAGCIDKVPLGSKQALKGRGGLYIPFHPTAAQPVFKLDSNSFYGSVSLDPVEARLFCPKRSNSPDCSWCPCRARRYNPPPRKPGK